MKHLQLQRCCALADCIQERITHKKGALTSHCEEVGWFSDMAASRLLSVPHLL